LVSKSSIYSKNNKCFSGFQAVSESTHPASLLFGNTINLDRGIISPLVKLDTGIISSKTISNEAVSISNDEQKNTKNNVLSNEMLQLQEAIIKAAQEKQLINDAYHFTISISKPKPSLKMIHMFW
jgi:hypothetical protein